MPNETTPKVLAVIAVTVLSLLNGHAQTRESFPVRDQKASPPKEAARPGTYPDKPIRFIVPSAAGGGADIYARHLATELASQMKQPFVVDNRASSGGVIGMQLLVKARADGYTLGFANLAYLAIGPALVPNLPYDVNRDIQPIGQFTTGQNLLAAGLALPVQSVQELIAYARSNPGKLSFGSAGNGSITHLSMEMFKLMTGTQIVHVPYKAIPQAITDMIGGQVHLIVDNVGSILPHVKAGRVRGLAVTGGVRSTVLPELPTIAEAGVPGYEVSTWTGMIAPEGLPMFIVARLNAEIQRACASPALAARIAGIGGACATGSTEQFVDLVKRERAKWADTVRRSGARID